jgi:hypothetical protein
LSDNELELYKSKLLDLRERLIRSLGVETVNVLVDRSLEEVLTVYPGLAAIQREGDDLILDGLEEAYRDRPEADVRAAFSALYAVMLLMLARMLGKEIALRLADTKDARRVLEGEDLGPR